jgi:hypothetical protein
MQTISNAAIFHNGQKKMTKVNALVDGEDIFINNGTTGVLINQHKIVKTAKVGMAWDIEAAAGTIIRLTIQEGCGCGGMKFYSSDEEYTGTLDFHGVEVIQED